MGGFMELYGYKAFNSDLTNRYGQKFEVGKTYHANGPIRWGNYGNGFHFCHNLEDCLCYFDASLGVEIAKVRGYGTIKAYNDEYYGYYDMYVCEYLDVIKVLSREEIINELLKTTEERWERFCRNYNLTEEEKELFYIKNGGIKN